jgi:hypothetical protein
MAINYDTQRNVSVILPIEVHEALKELAKKNRRTVSAQVCVLIEEALKEANIQVENKE